MLSTIDIYAWFILPFLIFASRVADVSLGTIRVVFITRGMKYLAPVIGFFEVLIWLIAISQIMQNLTSPYYYVAYALGFATGNYVGIIITEKLSLGMVILRVITVKDSSELIKSLSEYNYGVTTIEGKGTQGNVKILFTIVPKKKAEMVISLIKQFNPKAFYSMEDIDKVSEGVFPMKKNSFTIRNISNIRPLRKGK